MLVELGWGLNGPVRVSRANQKARQSIYALSILTKLITILPTATASALVAWLISPEYRLESALAAVAATSLGMSPAWFFIGRGKPFTILLTDAIPKVAVSIAAATVITFGGALLVYPIGLLLAALVSPILGAHFAKMNRYDLRRFHLRHLFKAIWYQALALRGRAASALYISLPVTIIGAVSPESVVMFSAAERLQRMYLSVFQSVPSSLLPWVSSSTDRTERRTRALRSIWLNLIVGIFAAWIFAACSPMASELLFSGVATIPWGVSLICAVIILFTCLSRATGGIALVSFHKISAISDSATLGALIGIPGVAILGAYFGTIGGLLGMTIAELSVLLYQVVATRWALRLYEAPLKLSEH